MIKDHCLKPHCIYWAMPGHKYCRKHTLELESKSQIYYDELQENTEKQNKGNVETDVLEKL